MARALTTITNAQTLTANTITPVLVTETSLASNTWQTAVLEFTLTNGGTPPTPGNTVHVYYAFSSTDLGGSYTTAPSVFDTVSLLEIETNSTPSGVTIVNSGKVDVEGDYLYTWVQSQDPLVQPVTVNLTITQTS